MQKLLEIFVATYVLDVASERLFLDLDTASVGEKFRVPIASKTTRLETASTQLFGSENSEKLASAA